MKKIALIFMFFIIIVGCTDNKTNNEENFIIQNNNEGVIKSQVVDGFIFDNVILKTNNGISTFSFKIKNNELQKIKINYIRIYTYDEKNNLLFKFNAYVGDYVEDELRLSSSISGDLTNVYSVKYEIVRI